MGTESKNINKLEKKQTLIDVGIVIIKKIKTLPGAQLGV